MRLPSSAHTSQPWEIHQRASEFDLLDVWALPTPGGPADFPRLVELFGSYDPVHSSSRVVRALFGIRLLLGKVFRLGDPEVTPHTSPFRPMFENAHEWAGELENKTVHGIVHLGWVPDGNGAYRGQLAVLVKPNGLVGKTYLAAIAPFRHLIVYPTLIRELEARWRD